MGRRPEDRKWRVLGRRSEAGQAAAVRRIVWCGYGMETNSGIERVYLCR